MSNDLTENKLEQSISSLRISVRAFHCFQQAGIKTLRDLVQKTDVELLEYRNFGKKTLRETQKLLSRMNLSLGQKGAESSFPKVNIDDIKQYEKLIIPISELSLSKRSLNCLREANIKMVACVVKRTEEELLKFKNFGKKSLREIKERLAGLGLELGEEFDCQKFQAFSATCSNRSSHSLQAQELSLSQCLSYIGEKIIEPNSLKKHIKNRKMLEIIQSRFFLDKKKTLEEIGKSLSITRERVRQLENGAINVLYDLLDMPNKRFVHQFANEIKEGRGIKVLENDSCAVSTLEFKLFNIILKRWDKKIEFDNVARFWLDKRNASLVERLDKELLKKCILGNLYSSDDIKKLAQYVLEHFNLPENSHLGLTRLISEHWFKKVQNQHAFKSISGVEICAGLIKEYYPKGIALYRDIDSFITLTKTKGYAELSDKNKRALIGYILRSDDLLLWDWGVYIHKDNIKIDQSLLEEVDKWLYGKFKPGVSRVSLWGAFSQLEKQCKARGIPNEHALYSCMKLKYGNKYHFLKVPHVYAHKVSEPIAIGETLEKYVKNADSIVEIKQIMNDLGLKDYQITQHLLDSGKILQCENGRYIHEDKLNFGKQDLRLMSDFVAREVKLHKHISVRHIYEENVVTCKKCNVLDPRVLYSILSKKLYRNLFFPRFPYILEKDHRIETDKRFSFNDLVNHFFDSKKRVVYYKELHDYFVKERRYPDSMVGNICYLCDNVLQYAKGAYISLETLNWTSDKLNQLEGIATKKFQDCCKAGHFYAEIDVLLEETLPKIDDLIDVSWQKKLLIELLERINTIRILGSMDSVYVVVPNANQIDTTEDLVCSILKKEFNGAANKDQFLKHLHALKITKVLDHGGRKYKIINEEIINQGID